MQEKVRINMEELDPSMSVRLSKYGSVIEASYSCFWSKPFLVRAVGLGGGFIDFQGKPHAIDVLGYGMTLEEAIEETLTQLERR